MVGFDPSDKVIPTVLETPRGVSYRKLVKTVGIYILTGAWEEGFRGLIDEWAAFEEALNSLPDERAIERIKASVECSSRDITPEGVRRISEALED